MRFTTNVKVVALLTALFIGMIATAHADELLERLHGLKMMGKGIETDTAALEPFYLRLLDMFPQPGDKGKVYAALSKMYCDAGLTDPESAIKYAEEAMHYPLEPKTSLEVHIQLGDSSQVLQSRTKKSEFAEVRPDIARVYLEGLRIALDSKIPEERVPLVAVGKYNIYGPVEDPKFQERVKKMEEEHQAQMAAWQEAQRINDMVMLRNALERQIVSLYSKKPRSAEGLIELASEILDDPEVVDALLDKVKESIASAEASEAKAKIRSLARPASGATPANVGGGK